MSFATGSLWEVRRRRERFKGTEPEGGGPRGGGAWAAVRKRVQLYILIHACGHGHDPSVPSVHVKCMRRMDKQVTFCLLTSQTVKPPSDFTAFSLSKRPALET